MSLEQLHHLSAAASVYVDGFLHRAGLHSCHAFALEMGGGAFGLVGAFDPDPMALSPRDMATLRLLFRRLRVVSRSVSDTAQRWSSLPGLSKRQREVVALIAQGLSNAQIAATLVLTEDTVKKYVSRALAATGCRTRTELAIRALS